MITTSQVLVLIGSIVVLKYLYDFVSFIAFHFSSPSVHRYLYGRAPYALVTGATDGIGKATAKELYMRGFNVILHGRNPEKLHHVEEELRGLGSRDVKTWVEDACRVKVDFAKAIEQWKDLEITVVVHNVGGAPVRPQRIDEVPENDLLNDVRRNALFPLLLSRAILPKLRQASGPAAMVFVSSFAGTSDLLRLVPYAPTKAFITRLSGCLGMDERFWVPTNVETMTVVVGSVVSGSHPVALSPFSPSSETFARRMVDRIGCGKRVVAPYLPHALQFWAVSLLPQVLLDNALVKAMEGEVRMYKKL